MTRARDLTFVQAATARRALNRVVAKARPGLQATLVWHAVADETLGYARTSDRIGREQICAAAALAPAAVRRALRTLTDLGVIAYQPGYRDSTTRQNVKSILTVILPVEEPRQSPQEETQASPLDD